jgi:TolA-binding protein
MVTLNQLLHHLLWAANCSNGSEAREALQTLLSIGSRQVEWMRTHDQLNALNQQISSAQDAHQQAQMRRQLIHLQKQLAKLNGFDNEVQTQMLMPVLDHLLQIALTRTCSTVSASFPPSIYLSIYLSINQSIIYLK